MMKDDAVAQGNHAGVIMAWPLLHSRSAMNVLSRHIHEEKRRTAISCALAPVGSALIASSSSSRLLVQGVLPSYRKAEPDRLETSLAEPGRAVPL